MSERCSMFDDSSEQEGSFFGASSASLMSFSHSSSYQPGGQDAFARTNQFSAILPFYTPQYGSHTSSIAWTKSTGSKRISYTTCDEWVRGVSPCFPVWREPGPPLSSASSLNDPVLRSFASHTPSASPANSAIRQTAGLNTPSSSSTGSTESDETDHDEEQPDFGEGDEELGTPDTSDASVSDIIFVFDQVDGDQVAVIPSRELLIGLQLPEQLLKPPSFSDTNDDNNIDDIDEFLRNRSTNFQAEVNAIPYTAGIEGFWRPDYDGATLAPSPGLAYDEYYLRTRKYTKGHKKAHRKRDAILESCKAEPTFDELVAGTTECFLETTPYVLCEGSGAWIEARGKRSEDRYNNEKHCLETVQTPNLCHPVQIVKYSLETLASTFHPSFLVSHLSRTSLSSFTDDIYAPNNLIHDTEYSIHFSFPIGPPIILDVCAFTPRDYKAIRSYQKQQGKDKLDVQDSLPIAVNLFDLELQAADLDRWLDRIVGSKSRLSEYVDVMLLRHPGQPSPQILKALVSWYQTFRKELSKTAAQILRTSLKLLITTTLLSLVPKVTHLSEPLSNYLSHYSQYPHAAKHISTTAPKLLTRQIKTSIYHLQRDLLCHIFHHFGCETELDAEVKVAVAIIVAYVLDLLKHDGRQFAKYSRAVNSTVEVKEQEILQYETNLQTQVFDRVRASIIDAAEKTGRLGEKLRNLGSMVKGKGKETQEGTFLSAILNTVIRSEIPQPA